MHNIPESKQAELKKVLEKRLELLSDCVRRGEPLSFGEAIEVVHYQRRLQASRGSPALPLLRRFWNWVRSK